MSDKVVFIGGGTSAHEWTDLKEVAKLEADLRKMALDYLAAQGQAAEAYQAQLAAEHKLARAVEALERIASGEFSGRMLTSMPPQDAAQYFARTTLAELKGEDRG
jgi:hypothetical protein